jgi:hypothetical protein
MSAMTLLQERRPSATSNDDDEITVEAVAHAILRVVCDFPGQIGRVKVARVVGGFALGNVHDPSMTRLLASYSVDPAWLLNDVTRLVDAMIEGGLLAQTVGARPTVVLTRDGFRALVALDDGEEWSNTDAGWGDPFNDDADDDGHDDDGDDDRRPYWHDEDEQ